MFKKSPLKATRLVRRKRRIRNIKIAAIIIAVILFVAGASFVTKLKTFAIATITVEGNSAIDAGDIERLVKKDISGSYLYLFSKSNIFLYPKKIVLNDISTLFKRVDNVTISRSGLNTLIVSIQERVPAYTWCKGEPPAKRDCYLVDGQGYIFSEAPVFSGNAFFGFYGNYTGTEPIGATYLNAEKFKYIDTLIAWLKENEIPTYALLAKDNDMYELSLNSGGKIIFKNLKNAEAVSLLESTIKTVMLNTDVFSKNSGLEYIDLRYGNKVYYKFTGQKDVKESQ